MNKSRGFTIIELIVVIAIIAILAAIVLINVTGYINRGKNSSIKADLATLSKNAALFYTSNGFTYNTGVKDLASDSTNGCGPNGKVYKGIAKASGFTTDPLPLVCQAGTDTWCACSPLVKTPSDPVGSTYCIDSTGATKETITTCDIECSSDYDVCSNDVF